MSDGAGRSAVRAVKVEALAGCKVARLILTPLPEVLGLTVVSNATAYRDGGFLYFWSFSHEELKYLLPEKMTSKNNFPRDSANTSARMLCALCTSKILMLPGSCTGQKMLRRMPNSCLGMTLVLMQADTFRDVLGLRRRNKFGRCLHSVAELFS